MAPHLGSPSNGRGGAPGARPAAEHRPVRLAGPRPGAVAHAGARPDADPRPDADAGGRPDAGGRRDAGVDPTPTPVVDATPAPIPDPTPAPDPASNPEPASALARSVRPLRGSCGRTIIAWTGRSVDRRFGHAGRQLAPRPLPCGCPHGLLRAHPRPRSRGQHRRGRSPLALAGPVAGGPRARRGRRARSRCRRAGCRGRGLRRPPPWSTSSTRCSHDAPHDGPGPIGVGEALFSGPSQRSSSPASQAAVRQRRQHRPHLPPRHLPASRPPRPRPLRLPPQCRPRLRPPAPRRHPLQHRFRRPPQRRHPLQHRFRRPRRRPRRASPATCRSGAPRPRPPSPT